MDDRLYVEQIKNEIAKCNITLKSLIQDIYNCTGPLEVLNKLNAQGRGKLTDLRSNIEELESYGKDKQNEELIADSKNYKEQYYSTFSMFRKANVTCMLAIDKTSKEELFKESKESVLKHRHKKDKVNLVKFSSNITDQLLSISRHLSDTTQLSAETLQTLGHSSTTVSGTKSELNETKSALSQSGKLLDKYSRRQFTDKLLLLLGFLFFLACVFYVLQRRVF